MLEYNDNVHIYPEKKLQRHMIIDEQQYSAFSFLPMLALALVSILQSTVHILGRVSGTGNRHPIPRVSYQ